MRTAEAELLEETEAEMRDIPFPRLKPHISMANGGTPLTELPCEGPMNPADHHFEFARSLFREANDAFFLFDPRTRIIADLNPAAMR